MLFTTSFIGMIFVALAMGVTKGVRTVYMNIVIPSYVPIERLPFASGIQMFFNGIVIITLGTVLGKIFRNKFKLNLFDCGYACCLFSTTKLQFRPLKNPSKFHHIARL